MTKNRKKELFKWVEKHKIHLSIGAGVLLLSGVGIMIGMKTKRYVKVPVVSLPMNPINDSVAMVDIAINEAPINVKGSSKSTHIRKEHIRDLGNRVASDLKRLEALQKGLNLTLHETLVNESRINWNGGYQNGI